MSNGLVRFMAKPENATRLQIEVVYAPAPRQVYARLLELSAGATLNEAVTASVFQDFPELRSVRLRAGVWGKEATPEQMLRHHDRVEIYRELRVDPKIARRERFRSQGAKTTGLFAKTRVGGKAGY